ncbi:MAG TPA: sugar phosphate isomerase/epimerase [Candidatus Dormibacteraeota bacterium]|nr:sugar phosphate isomerase/epimerase [Candidatus Dormibacteraeota bacterium]
MRGRGRTGAHRLALSPACWGISDQKDWGHQLDSERVLSEAAAVGEGAITAGPSGFLPNRSDHAKAVLRRQHLRVVAGHVHGVLHVHEQRGPELAHIDGHAHWLSAVGAHTLVLSAIWDRGPLSPAEASARPQWAHVLHSVGSVEHVCARHRLKLAVMPRFGGMIQGTEHIERLLVGSEAGLCLDLAQLALAGADPLDVIQEAAGRIVHVQLNDIDAEIARRVRDRSLDFAGAVSRGLYKPIGEGSIDVRAVTTALRNAGYRGWYTLEQEVRLNSNADRPLGRISRSLEYVLPLLN